MLILLKVTWIATYSAATALLIDHRYLYALITVPVIMAVTWHLNRNRENERKRL